MVGGFTPEMRFKLRRVAEWIVPKKILELLISEMRSHCEGCGRGYPSKSIFLKYLFWELWALWWKLSRKYNTFKLRLGVS